MFKTNHYKIFSVIFVFLSFFSFFVGFYLDENSAGGGNYTGDFSLIWKNLQLFINNDILIIDTASGERLTPFAKDLILFFDKDDKKLVMTIHKGIIE